MQALLRRSQRQEAAGLWDDAPTDGTSGPHRLRAGARGGPPRPARRSGQAYMVAQDPQDQPLQRKGTSKHFQGERRSTSSFIPDGSVYKPPAFAASDYEEPPSPTVQRAAAVFAPTGRGVSYPVNPSGPALTLSTVPATLLGHQRTTQARRLQHLRDRIGALRQWTAEQEQKDAQFHTEWLEWQAAAEAAAAQAAGHRQRRRRLARQHARALQEAAVEAVPADEAQRRQMVLVEEQVARGALVMAAHQAAAATLANRRAASNDATSRAAAQSLQTPSSAACKTAQLQKQEMEQRSAMLSEELEGRSALDRQHRSTLTMANDVLLLTTLEVCMRAILVEAQHSDFDGLEQALQLVNEESLGRRGIHAEQMDGFLAVRSENIRQRVQRFTPTVTASSSLPHLQPRSAPLYRLPRASLSAVPRSNSELSVVYMD